jgi:hypothetical protein
MQHEDLLTSSKNLAEVDLKVELFVPEGGQAKTILAIGIGPIT